MLHLCWMNLNSFIQRLSKSVLHPKGKRELLSQNDKRDQDSERKNTGETCTGAYHKYGVFPKPPMHSGFLCLSYASELMEKKGALGGLYSATTSSVYHDGKLTFTEQTQQWENIAPVNIEKILLE